MLIVYINDVSNVFNQKTEKIIVKYIFQHNKNQPKKKTTGHIKIYDLKIFIVADTCILV